ncbi:protein of unknown function DUF897 [Thermocrinis albus DSM 14484]|uniref:Sodium-dependent bicarbonate transport family permease n=1 Tax=Thermocrinis albus (strain DSM 14484 / JCM 11386 / HI 11/12) TaxID=638303 RepID=D3SQ53_THEAH|nr:sodium-dependent bicarbonate transport family permease [Thermocrinis albus]ADC89290.1 protein of unknown function DUF897 [Thermocrinis albus DSM 14484]
MSWELVLNNILQPPILFFFLGFLATLLKSDLDIPHPLPKLFSLYLLISIGLQGGYKIAHSGLNQYVLITLLIAMLMAVLVPLYSFFLLRWKLDVYNAAGIAATYGSISAVTFVTATTFLQSLGVHHGGHMVAAMTLMESPAIILGLILANLFGKRSDGVHIEWKDLLREAFFNGSVLILLGSLIVGYITGEKGWEAMKPLYGDLFKGFLAFFLLDMGLVASRRVGELKKVGPFLLIFAIFVPIVNAHVALMLAKLVGTEMGDAFLLAVLSASASYIAVPAALRIALPEANPGLYITMSLSVTFPFNISIGIPLYYYVANLLWG